VLLTGSHLTVETLVDLVRSKQMVGLSEDALERIARSREVLLSQPATRSIYGRSSGVGPLKDVGVPRDVASDLKLLRSHATSGGDEVSTEAIRALMIIRLNQLARGGAGVSVRACQRLVEIVNHQQYPRLHRGGSLGTGDLPQLARVGLLLAEPTSDRTSTSAAGALEQGDALGLISSSALTLADCALASEGLRSMLKASAVVAALTWLAVKGNREHFSEAASPALRTDDALRVARWLRELLGQEDYDPVRIQETFALRVFPSSVGAVLWALGEVVTMTEDLMNAAVENPLVSASSGEITHHGGFYNLDLALALDAVTSGLSQVSSFALSRIGLLADRHHTGVPDYLGDGSPGASGVMMLEYFAAWRVASMRMEGGPAALQSIPVSQNLEENASFASIAAVRLAGMCSTYASVLACELVAAVRALRLAGTSPCGPRLVEAVAICAALPEDQADRDLTEDIAVASGLLPQLADLLDPF
jgi:histidine ammonia-lyase